MAAPDPIDSLVEEREAKMVAFSGLSQRPIMRKGLFLKPPSLSSNRSNNGSSQSPTPPHTHPPYINQEVIPKLIGDFRWWADPQFLWPLWVEKLRPKYTTLWKNSGIFDAIMESKYKIRRDPSSLLGISRFWSQETNTFIFPWGEATITLEDVMVLGGFSVLGEPVRIKDPLGGDLGHLEFKMRSGFRECKRKHGKVEQSVWLGDYMKEGKGGEIEHVAFLSLWLSKFVLAACNGRNIRECVFQIAVRLVKGVRIALAPAVLASIYRDLYVMKKHVEGESSVLAIWAPINVFQLWIWERFSALRLGSKNSYFDRPMAGRWNLSGKKFDSSFVMSVLKSPNEFKWRPYSKELEHKHSMYMNKGGWFCSSDTQDEGLQSFARCLRDCELVGLDCIEQYLPHRVAMQFGLDQDIPSSIPRANSSWELAWKTYDISSKNVKFFVPPRLFKADVTLKYYNWWKRTGKKRKDEHISAETNKKKAKDLNFETRETVEEKSTGEEEKDSEEERQILDEYGDGYTIREKAESNNKIEERNPVKNKDLELDMEIEELRKEISSIQARIKYLESLPESRTARVNH